MNCYKYYDLYNQDRFVSSVEDLDYALLELLTGKITHFISYKYTNERNQSIECGIFKINDNKVIKIIDDIYVSIYSPYDEFLFTNPNLSRLYLKFYNSDSNFNFNKNMNKINPILLKKQSIIPVKTNTIKSDPKETNITIKDNISVCELSLDEVKK